MDRHRHSATWVLVGSIACVLGCGSSTSVDRSDGGVDSAPLPSDASLDALVDGSEGGMPVVDAGDRCSVVKASIDEAGFGTKASVRCDEKYAYIAGDTYHYCSMLSATARFCS
jgi:hypothetical protein